MCPLVYEKRTKWQRFLNFCSMTTFKLLLKRTYLNCCRLQPNPYFKLLKVQVKIVFFCAHSSWVCYLYVVYSHFCVMWDWTAAVNILAIVYGLRYMVVLLLMQVDAAVIMAMTDDEWERYLPAYGDRIAVKSFLRAHGHGCSSVADDAFNRPVLNRLRQKIAERRRKSGKAHLWICDCQCYKSCVASWSFLPRDAMLARY